MRFPLIVLGVTLLGGCTDGDSNYFRALSQPPKNVGTCIGASVRRGSGARHLVMTAPESQRQREIFMGTDKRGRMQYIDFESVSPRVGTIQSEQVVAQVDDNGGVAGVHSTGTTIIDFGATVDSAVAGVLRRRPTQEFQHKLLTEAEQQRVREMLAWLTKRCREEPPPVSASTNPVVIHDHQ